MPEFLLLFLGVTFRQVNPRVKSGWLIM